MSRTLVRPRTRKLRVESLEDRTTPVASPGLRPGYSFTGPSFDDNNPIIAGPASPGLAVGEDHTVGVVNARVQVQPIPNGTPTSTSLQAFFGPESPSANTIWSNPRTLYDHFNGRFIVAAIGVVSAAQNSSLYIAVSKTGVPTTNTADWWYTKVATQPVLNGTTTYAGYMGLGLDGTSVYATTSQHHFGSDAYQDARVIVLSKTAGANGGWYGGGTVTHSGLLDPSPVGEEARYYGLVPAMMYTTPTAPGAGIGTYLVAYNGAAGVGAGNEAVEVVALTNPTTTPAFTPVTITVGDIDDTSTGLPQAPQPHNGSNFDLALGPRRLGNAVWRDNRLYFAGTVKTGSATDAAHWFQVRTTDNTVEQQANVDASAVATGLSTFHPAVAVDVLGNLAVAFGASNGSRGAAGYYSARTANDTANTLRDPVSLSTSTSNQYVRRDAAGNNFWGFTSGLAVDPNDKVFWTYNAAATTPGTVGTAPDLGRWVTSGGAFSFNWPPDASTIPDINTTDNTPPFTILLNQYFSDFETTNPANFTYTVSSTDPAVAQVEMISQQIMRVTIPRPTEGTVFITVTAADPGTADAPPASVTTRFKIRVTHEDLPAEVTINQGASQADPTNQTAVVFDVVFDQAVTGFEPNDVSLSTSSAPGTLVASITQIDPANYTVTITGMTGDGNVVATVRPNAAFNPSNQGSLDSTSTDNVITVDYTRPTVVINQAAGQADPTNGPIQFLAAFSEAVVGFDGSDVSFAGSTAPGTLSASVVPNGVNTFLVTVTGMTGPGTVVASIPADAVPDVAGNGTVASTSTDNTVTFDNAPPTVTVNQAAAQADPAGGTSVTFDVVFNEPVTGFTGSDVSFAGSSAPGTLSAAVSGTGPAYTVTVTGMTAGGTVVASIPAGQVTDIAGNASVASTSTDNSVTFVRSGTVQFSAPTYAISEQGAPTLTVTVTRTDGSEGPLSVDYATADGTALAGIDYTGVSGTLSWLAGDTTSKTFDVPIIDDGGFETDSTFTVNLSNPSLPGALGIPSSATVTIRERAALNFELATDNTAESETAPHTPVTKVITVKRLFGTTGAVSVDYTIGGGSATAGTDFTGATTGTLSWADGETADKTITLDVVDDIVNEGRETIVVALSNPVGNAQLGAVATHTLSIAPSDGQTAGIPFTDSDGDLVTLKLGGGLGTLTYHLTNGAGPVSTIFLSGTSPTKSTVTAVIKKAPTGDGRVEIGEIFQSDGSGVRSISLAKVDLVGAGISMNGYLGTLVIGDVENGADILLTGPAPVLPKNAATRITALVIGDGTDISTAVPLTSLTAIAIGDGTITAPSVGSITAKGKAATRTTLAIPGDFDSDVTISGVGIDPVKGKALKSFRAAGMVSNNTVTVGGNVGTFKAGAITNTTLDAGGTLGPVIVKGAVTGSTLLADGNVGLVNVGSFVNSRLFAGYTGPDDGSGTFSAAATVGPFIVKNKTDGFANSHVIATNFKFITLASADVDNSNTPFGFVYRTNFAGLSVKVGTVTKKYDKVLGGTQTIEDDLRVAKVV